MKRLGGSVRWLVVLAVTFGIVAPSEARPRPRTRAAAVRPPATRAKVAPKPRPTVAPRTSIAGVARPGRDLPGRRASEATSPAERTADAIDAILRGPLRFGTTGLYVVDAASGAELFAVHADDPLNPASNVKLVSTATALAAVGPDFRYTTSVLGVLPDSAGAIAGGVYLHGSFDPTLAVGHLDALAGDLAARGVTEIQGDVVIGEQPTRDGIYRARVRVEVVAGAPGTAPTVTVGPDTAFVEVVNTATTSKRAKVRRGGVTIGSQLVTVDGQPRLRITVAGAIGKGRTVARLVTTKERNWFTAHLFRAALGRAGIAVGGVRTDALEDFVAASGVRLPVPLATHRSAPLAELIAQINKRSINWLSDRVLTTTVALSRGELPSMTDGVDAMYAWLDARAAIAKDGAVLDTGSGLSYRTELSPRQLVRIVRAAAGYDAGAPDDDAAVAFRRSLAVAGVDGTLRGRFRSPLRGRVEAKTGTLTGVIALSGLLHGGDGRTLAFALVSNGHPPRRKLAVRAAHERILAELDRYLGAVAPAPAVDAVAPTSELDRTTDGLADDLEPASGE